ncbi:MAG: hypothetical protein C4530_08220 [Desulfobacteraceae bacterium]|nr:MAG: hypothetical protein C4530_08220 [Desulfobacteraceae bacterium]
MREDFITIRFENDTVTECSSAIIIPERAMIEAGHIRTLTTNSEAHSKHEFHAIAQIALSRFQDGELEAEAVNGPLTVQSKNEIETVTAGIVVFLDSQGNFHLIGNPGQNVNKLLQIAHRFCARWIRLDI